MRAFLRQLTIIYGCFDSLAAWILDTLQLASSVSFLDERFFEAVFSRTTERQFFATLKLAAVVYKKVTDFFQIKVFVLWFRDILFFLGDVTGYPAISTEFPGLNLGKTQIYQTDLDNTVMNEKNSTGYLRIQERN